MQQTEKNLLKSWDLFMVNPNQTSPHLVPWFMVMKPGKSMEQDRVKALRLISNHSGLKHSVQRQVSPFPTTEYILREINKKSNLFFTCDLLVASTRPGWTRPAPTQLTLFNGTRYKYARAPQGLSLSKYRITYSSFCGVSNIHKQIDDVLGESPVFLEF